MAYLSRRERGPIYQPMYSRWHSPDRRLYTEAERDRIGVDMHHQWWEYYPDLVQLPVRPLTPEAIRGLERTLPF